MREQIFIGGAWPYANGFMHVGHLAALLPADIMARYFRQKGAKVLYVSGSDTHGTPITLRAKNNGVSPNDIVDYFDGYFRSDFERLDFSYDLYTTTETSFHKSHVQKYLTEINKNGYMYEREDDEAFCPSCNTFLADRELIGTCPVCGSQADAEQCPNCLTNLSPAELKDKKCKTCHGEIVYKKNKHLYFALSKFASKLTKFVEENKSHWRLTTINESEKYLKQGLPDRALTRQLNWGIEIPFPGFEDKRMYVWFEAVLGYLTAGERIMQERGEDFASFIRDKNTKCYYVHGKDNITFHTIILPALLEAIDPTIRKPDNIVACEYVNISGDKMSKSKGNLVTVGALLENFSSDSIRYFFMYFNPEKKDMSFSVEDFVDIHNKHLVGGYGNFVNRNLSFLVKKFNGELPQIDVAPEVIATVQNAYKKIGELIESGENRAAVEEMFLLIKYANKFYDDNAPWTLYSTDKPAFDRVTSSCLYLIANLANITAPLMPKAANKVFEFLGIKQGDWAPINYNPDKKLENISVLFNRIMPSDVDLTKGPQNKYDK